MKKILTITALVMVSLITSCTYYVDRGYTTYTAPSPKFSGWEKDVFLENKREYNINTTVNNSKYVHVDVNIENTVPAYRTPRVVIVPSTPCVPPLYGSFGY